MNLLEHYIIRVISKEKIINPLIGREIYVVKALVDCYGQLEQMTGVFDIEEWEEAKKKGYYMA